MQWAACTIDELDVKTLYKILQLRSQVFVLEQNCVYQDLDGVDLEPTTVHVYATHEKDGAVVAYGRVYHNDGLFLGRIVSANSVRGTGTGRTLLGKLIEAARPSEGDAAARPPITIAAQSYLLKFYSSFGFKPIGEEYLEDGIPHTDMRLE